MGVIMADAPQKMSNQYNAHDASRYANAIKNRERAAASEFAERNFIGKRSHNIAGVAAGGALQARRLGGFYQTGTATK